MRRTRAGWTTVVLATVVLASVVALGARGAAPVAADEPVFALPPDPRDLGAARIDWMGVYVQGAKVGFGHEAFRREGEGAAAVYAVTSASRVQLTSMRRAVTMETSERRTYATAPPFGLLAARSTSTEAGRVRVVELTRVEGGFAPRVTEDGTARTLPTLAGDFTLADELGRRTWCRGDRKPGDRARFRTLDVDDARFETQAMEVVAVARPAGAAGVRYELTVRDDDGSTSTVRADGDGRVLAMSKGSLIEARLEPEAEARRLEAGGDLFRLGIASVDRPLGDPRRVVRLVLEAEGERAEGIVDAPRQAVHRDPATGRVVVTLGAAAPPSRATDEEVARALEETVDCPIRLPSVVALAARAVGDATDPAAKVARLVAFVDGFVEDAARPASPSIAALIAAPRGDCTEHAALFVVLARAVGVPARGVSGLMYLGDDERGFGGHTWAEVALDGSWIQVDPTWRQTTVDATHIVLDRDRPGGRPSPPLGTLQFRVLDLKQR